MRRSGAAAAALLLLALASCAQGEAGWAVLQGNSAFLRGEFQRASLDYLAALELTPDRDVVAYNLGNVYNALGETNTALTVWGRITRPGSEELSYRLAFNRGYLFYQRGQYDAAAEQFRAALLMKPASLDAKKNLELCLLKTQNFGPALPARPKAPDRTEPGETQKALLDYINRLEGTRWKADLPGPPASVSSSDW